MSSFALSLLKNSSRDTLLCNTEHTFTYRQISQIANIRNIIGFTKSIMIVFSNLS